MDDKTIEIREMLRVMGGLKGYIIAQRKNYGSELILRANALPGWRDQAVDWTNHHIAHDWGYYGPDLIKQRPWESAAHWEDEDLEVIQEAYEQWALDLEDKLSGR